MTEQTESQKNAEQVKLAELKKFVTASICPFDTCPRNYECDKQDEVCCHIVHERRVELIKKLSELGLYIRIDYEPTTAREGSFSNYYSLKELMEV